MGATKTEEGVPQGQLLRRPTEDILTESIKHTKKETATIERLSVAIKEYLSMDDYGEYENESACCLLLGQLELSKIRRTQMLCDDLKDLESLTKENSQASP